MTRISSAEVEAFLHEFERRADREDFALIRDMIDEHAYYRFSDCDFIGRDAIHAAFEKTWRGDPSVTKARFYLSDVTVLTVDERTATATHTFNWEGAVDDRPFASRGRGTRVVVREGGAFRIVHEHLSRFPDVT